MEIGVVLSECLDVLEEGSVPVLVQEVYGFLCGSVVLQQLEEHLLIFHIEEFAGKGKEEFRFFVETDLVL